MNATVALAAGLAVVGTVLCALAARLIGLARRVNELEQRDPLTGTANRRAFLKSLETEVRRCRAARAPVTVAILDCDGFKRINESYGHSVGDEMLRAAADGLVREIGNRGVVARLWGDAFGILIPSVPPPAVRTLLEKLKRALDEEMAARHWPVTFSIGAATFDMPPKNAARLVDAADGMMFSVKREGRNNLACRGVSETALNS